MTSTEEVDKIIEDLKRIPKKVDTVVNIKEIAEEVSKVIERKLWRSY